MSYLQKYVFRKKRKKKMVNGDDSDIVCDEIIYDMDTVATKMTNAIVTINLGVNKLS